MKASESKRRWFYPQPAWLIVLSLASTGFLFLSEQGKWFAFNQHKGWTVLIAVASAAAVLAVMLLWWLAALVFRWRFQFSIRSLLILVVAIAMPCSWLAVAIQRANTQRNLVTQITHATCTIGYDWEWDATGSYIRSGRLPEPRWLVSLLGADFFETIVLVDCTTNATDVTLAKIARLGTLQDLSLNGTQVTDDGMERVRQLTELKKLSLWETQIGNRGLEKLAELSSLQELCLYKTHVTDDGLRYLRGMSRLESLSLDGTKVTDAGLCHLEELKQLRELGLIDTSVTETGVTRLRQVLPSCVIDY
jgi:hypothetical protein